MHLAKQQAAAEITFQNLTICLVSLIDVNVNIDIPFYLCQNIYIHVLLDCITFHYSIVCKFTIDSFLDMVMILYVMFVLRQ